MEDQSVLSQSSGAINNQGINEYVINLKYLAKEIGIPVETVEK